ncbi:Kinesin-like protein KIF26A [Collichthys lucidus]|uniref:Kinesin-like protein KIF26A n=1 Tax=Collichthys lucidus TaxID=240159 RepID=A0A4U5VEH5_COLLU|nr:Kinesin-like protein KIF26A [Collichthys lucidus]
MTTSTSSISSSTLTPCRLRSSSQQGLPAPIASASPSPSPSSSAAASFFISFVQSELDCLLPGVADTVAAPAEAMKVLQPVDKPGCESIQGLSGAVKAEVLMEIQPGLAALGIYSKAAQKLNLSSKRKKHQALTAPPTGALHLPHQLQWHPAGLAAPCPAMPAPSCVQSEREPRDGKGGRGEAEEAEEERSLSPFLKVDSRKKQLTLYDPASSPHSSAGHRRSATVAVPKIFAFDAVFTQEASQAEVCSGTVAEVIQSVVNGADGCIFCFGQVKLGKTYTMIGKDSTTQSLGIVPCAISWLFKLINERKEKTGTRFSVRVSAVEIFGKDEELKDLLSEVSTGSLQEGQSPGIHLREDPICGTQDEGSASASCSTITSPNPPPSVWISAVLIAPETQSNGSRIRVSYVPRQLRKPLSSWMQPSLHAAPADPVQTEEDRRNSHMLFTLHIYQYRMEKSWQRRKDSKLTMLLRESLGNINCRTTMIAHISDSPANYADSLTTIQLASRIHRMRKKKSKYASSSSGGESSCEEGRIRRPPHLRPFHPRTVALDPDLPSMLSDPDYSSSSEQSCDTVIYVGPGGTAISDRELSDNEGPPAFVPIIPSLNRKKPAKEGPLDRDQFFKCNTFAELQERLECIDGSEEPTAFVGEGKRSQGSPKAEKSKESQGPVSPKTVANVSYTQESISPKQSPKSVATPPSCSPNTKSKLDSAKTQCIPATPSDSPVVREKVYFNKKALPKPAPPPSQQRDSSKENTDNEERSSTRMPPVGMSHQAVKRRDPYTSPLLRAPVEVCQVRSTLRERCLDRDILRATVTLQQPVELNGEDELVFTVVEELSIGSIVDKGRPSSIISFNSDCSLQALASGSRPVSIISSINDEFDAYTSASGRIRGPSIVHSSLPRKIKPTSSISHSSSSSSSSSREPPRQEAKQEDPWQRSDNHSEPQFSDSNSTSKFLRNPPSGIPSSKTSNNSNSVPRPPKVQGSTSSQRVVDGCEKSASKNPPSKMPQLRRGATTLGTVPVIHSSTDYKGAQDIIASTTSLKFSSLGKNNKANSQKASNLPKPGCTSPPPPPVRKSSLDHKTKTLLPQSALKSAYGEAGRASGARAAVSEDELEVKASANPRALGAVNGSKARSLSANNSKGLSSSTKSLATPVTRNTNANLPPSGRTSAPRTTAATSSKPGRGTIMGTKQAMRAANSRVSELATGNISGKHMRGSGDSDSGNDSGVNVSDDKSPIAMLPSPYSKITAPRRPQRYSSGHGSDNSSVLSGELPPAMGRTALFYHSGGSSGYESMIRDSEATGSASSAHDSMSESGMSSSGRTRSSKYPKKRANGFQRRRLIPAPLPDTSSLGKKASTAGQWVDLPPMSGPLKEPFEIKVYEIDDVERLQRRRQEETTEGLQYFNSKLKMLERRQQQVRELRAKHEVLLEELEDTKVRLMMDPSKWIGEFEVDPNLDKESPEYLEALAQATEELEFCVNLCKSRVMMVTCFDISMPTPGAQEGLREIEV